MTIGEVASHIGVNVQTIRFYERKGLLPSLPRTASGFRQFDDAVIKRLRFIRHAQEVGFTLREIGDMLSMRADPDGTCDEVRVLAEKKVLDLEDSIRRQQSMIRTLKRLTQLCNGKLSSTQCAILEALDDEMVN